jgi:hypothetical protein
MIFATDARDKISTAKFVVCIDAAAEAVIASDQAAIAAMTAGP